MTHPGRGILGGEQGVDNETNLMAFSLGQILMQPDRAAIWAQQHEVEIQNLKIQLLEKDKEIEDLRKKFQEIQQQNDDHQIKLYTKDEEINELKERIQTLEEEKKDLQEDLTRVEGKLKRLENEIKDLTKSKKSHEEESRKLKEDLQKVKNNLKATKENFSQENEKLKKEMKHMKETRALPALPEPLLPPALQTSGESLAKLHLGELCCQIQGSMYKRILPEHYTELRSYKVKSIMKDARKLLKTDDDKLQEAEKKWETLKSQLNWNEDFEDAMRSLQETRNIEAHPRLDELRLRTSAKLLEDQGKLKGFLSLEVVNELINVWKQLGTCE